MNKDRIITGLTAYGVLISILATVSILTPSTTEYEIYTNEDIYFVDRAHVTSETGLDTVFRNKRSAAEWLALRTADDTGISDWDVNSLLHNYTTVTRYQDGAVGVSIVNPYSSPDSSFFEIMNRLEIDTFNNVRYYYFED